MHSPHTLFAEARTFIEQCYTELGKSKADQALRLEQIASELRFTGTYHHTFEELEHGARMAWRNSNRCIGRLFWKSLTVIDARTADTPETVYRSLLKHIEYATNNGKIKPTITVFRASTANDDVRIWNHQLIRYAGYETGSNGIVGDPHSVPFTRVCQRLGWTGSQGAYDVLPIVVQVGNHVQWFSIPPSSILEVPIHHPSIHDIAKLGMRWYAVPIISDMALLIGGIRYSAAPFNGWYMGTEIGARNLADAKRYNMLPAVADVMGLSRTSDSTLWRDRALVELNLAVLHSFRETGVTIVDHHTAARQFAYFERTEVDAGRRVTGDWSWLIPPLSPATTHIFHSQYHNDFQLPNYVRQPCPYTHLL
ncbi:nitric oxide synthase oxygenase [Alicyclobacillus hesperidum subsp. aegles]|uniref:nitric oxide synthase oxygenase n=1 Tax=Alicyclobacillus hesperidum TaxID=89784 RepID=UPI002229F516|nr:nitric oxide synthase oxygenase [Alicyclobacillus hesperidum]GLG02339.1 nitric oxide synthase oxygenase [Alicyclobacillus hesperidum subsp. aegles]